MKQPDDDALLRTVQELIAIESTADNPAGLWAAYDYIKRMLADCGKDITIEEFESGGKPSLLAYVGPKRPEKFRVILNGHVDVVPGKPEQYAPVVRDHNLYGRGACDMKAAAAVLTSVFCEFASSMPYPLALQIVTDEESSGHNGTLHQIEQGIRGDFVICGECGRTPTVHTIANEAKGNLSASIGFRGKSAHGAYPWNGDNAALKAAHFVQLLHARYPTPAEATSQTTITVTSIVSGGIAHNKVPEYAVAAIDARYAVGDSNFATEADFMKLIAAIDPQAVVEEVHDFSAPLYTSPLNPLLLQLKAAAEKTEGAAFSFVSNNGTSDGRFYGAVGNEACEFGIAGEGQHGEDEYIPLRALYAYQTTMRDFLQSTALTEVLPLANEVLQT